MIIKNREQESNGGLLILPSGRLLFVEGKGFAIRVGEHFKTAHPF